MNVLFCFFGVFFFFDGQKKNSTLFCLPAPMRAYYLDNPSKIVSKPRLESLGVLYWHVPADTYKEDGFLEKICQERSYKNRDEVRISPTLIPNYEEKLKIFFTEYEHS